MTNDLSHQEIWDDSALQDSWNEALEEYNHYHSIHARGEKVEDVLQDLEKPTDATNSNTENPGEIDMNGHEDTEAQAKGGENVLTSPSTESPSNIPTTAKKDKENSKSEAENVPPGMPALPEHLIGAVHDEDLKKLLMSWYYSGYYTGYYEGKQAARLANPTG